MTQITVDKNLARQLREGSEVEICAPSGEVLGNFRSEKLRKLYARAECPVASDELERRRHEEGGRTLDEIISDIETAQ
jgi:hypothetical protein